MSNKGDIDAMNICVDKIRSLNIKTGDEVENLYHSFSKMTEDTVMHIIDIKQQSDTITKMQNERIDMMVQHATELENRVEERTRALKLEKERSQSLLLNILPIDVADELTRNPDKTIAKKFSNATVLFTDIVGFTKMSDNMAAEEVVTMLNSLISKFDERAKREHIEKIKTIGDAYMAAVGLSEASNQDASTMIQFAQGLIQDVRDFNAQNNSNLQIRLGINTGNLVAGVIGKSKFIYDIWGDTVNVASRMESTGRPMKIHVTETTFEQTKDKFSYSESAEIEVKGKGLMKTYFL
jgi:class 3 adenylate cyclase